MKKALIALYFTISLLALMCECTASWYLTYYLIALLNLANAVRLANKHR